MQINSINSQSLYELYGITDLQDPYENILAGVSIISGFVHQYGEHDGLMAYNGGVGGYQNAIANGTYTTTLRSNIMATKSEIEGLRQKRLISLENLPASQVIKALAKYGGFVAEIDKYLKVSRLIKRRTVANEARDASRVLVNGKPARASYDVEGWRCFEIQMVAIR